MLLLLVVCGVARADRAKLDAIVTRAPNLQAFLADAALVDDYFKALQEHYGKDRFPRSAYDAILTKLRTAVVKEPRIAARLWETNDLGQSFTIDVPTGGSGQRLDPPTWAGVKGTWEAQLDEKAAGMTDERIREVFKLVEARVAQINLEIAATEDPRKKVELQKSLFGGLASATGLDRVAAAYVKAYLAKKGVREAWSSGDADLVTEVIREARGETKLLTAMFPGLEAPSALAAELRRALPDANQWQRVPGLFKPVEIASNTFTQIPIGATPTGTYRFDPPLRRFHALWKGIPDKECVGGICEEASQGNLKKEPNLERILTIALEGSQLHEISLSGKHLGFVHAVPIERFGRKYASLEFGAAVLRRTVVVRDADGTRRAVPFMNLWYDAAMKAKPPTWQGYVLGTSRIVNNANVIDGAHSSDMFLLGETLGDSRYFKTTDPLAKVIPDLGMRRGDAAWVGGRMMFDAALWNQGDLRLLKPSEPTAMHHLLHDPDVLARHLAEVRNEVHRLGIFERVIATRPTNPEIQLLLIEEFINDRKEERYFGIDRLFREEAIKGLQTLPLEHPDVLARLVDALKENVDETIMKGIKDLVVQFAKTPEAQRRIVRLFEHPDPGMRYYAEEVLGRIKPTDPTVLADLRRLIQHKDPITRRGAIRTIGKIGRADLETQRELAASLAKSDNGAAFLALVATKPTDPDVLRRLNEAIKGRPVRARQLAAVNGAAADVVRLTPIDGTENLPPGASEFLHNEQVLHAKNLYSTKKFNLAMDPTYKQENRAKFQVPYYLIPIEDANFTEAPNLHGEIKSQLVVEKGGKKFYRYFVHPMSQDYFQFLADHPGVEYVGPDKSEFTGSVTMSFRSLLVWNDKQPGARPFMAKLGADIYEHGYHRMVDPAEVEKSMTNQRALDALGPDYLAAAKAKLFPETAGLTLKRGSFAGGPPNLGGQIIREIPDEVLKGEKKWIALGSLISPEGGREKPLIMDVIAKSGLPSAEFVKKYLIDDYFTLFQRVALDKGLPFQPNGQNLYLETDANHAPTGFFALRDAEGIYPDFVQAMTDPKLRQIYGGTQNPATFNFGLGRVYAVGAFMRDYRDEVFDKLLAQIEKHDPTFSAVQRRALLKALDAELIDRVVAHFGLPHLADLKPPLNQRLLSRLEELIAHNTRFVRRPDHVKIAHNGELAKFIARKKRAGETSTMYDGHKLEAYLSDSGIELVDSAGRIATVLPFNAGERAQFLTGCSAFKVL